MSSQGISKLHKAIPFILTALVMLSDQLSKSYIVQRWPNGSFISDVFDNGILWIIHVRNKAIAFSLGSNLPDSLRPILFIALPLVALGFLIVYYCKTNELTLLQRWSVAGILGGGLGNLIDRIFRPEGVVDFISVKFYGILGFERWPTFNVADSAVVVCVFLFLISMFASLRESSGK